MIYILFWLDAGTANREENYAKKAADFEHHSKRMADTASALAKTGGVTDRKLANDLISTSGKVSMCMCSKYWVCSCVHTLVVVCIQPLIVDNESSLYMAVKVIFIGE